MKTVTITRSSIFPAPRAEVFRLLQRVETLQEVAWPYASFTPVDEDCASDIGKLKQDPAEDHAWTEGSTHAFRFRLFGRIPFGTHRIRVIRFREAGILTHEGNEHVPVWNHTIILEELPGGKCRYTDSVEIGAGAGTFFVWLWAQAFYAHRQRKWIRLLRGKAQEEIRAKKRKT